LVAAERQRIEAVIPRGTRVVVLDERGTSLRTTALAQRLKDWQLGGDDVALIIGGPDGLEPAFRDAAHERIRLSDLTLPHAMARCLAHRTVVSSLVDQCQPSLPPRINLQ